MIGALEQEGKTHMQLVTSSGRSLFAAGADVAEVSAVTESRYSEYGTIRRNGAVVGFDPGKISVALTKAFPAIEGGQGEERAQFFRNPSDRVSDRKRAQLGLETFMPMAFERRQACVS